MNETADEEKGRAKLNFLGIDFEFTGILAGKVVFIIITTILFLIHSFFILKIHFILCLIAFLIPIAGFIILLKFGCIYFIKNIW